MCYEQQHFNFIKPGFERAHQQGLQGDIHIIFLA